MVIKPKSFTHSTNLISEKGWDSHITLYEQYVNKCNEIYSELEKTPQRDKADKNYSVYRGLKREMSYNLNAVMLHETFFRNIGKSADNPSNAFVKMAIKDFGGFAQWQEDFIATAKSARGWAIACYEQKVDRLCNILLDSHDDGMIVGVYPFIVFDAYEHAYFETYGSDNESYIKKFIDEICWDTVGNRVKHIEGSN